MDKNKLVAEMLTAKAEKNITIDLDTYVNGLADMYERLVNLCNLPVVSNRSFDGCCMGCDKWRHTNGRNGECMKHKIYTDEGFFCKDYFKGEYGC